MVSLLSRTHDPSGSLSIYHTAIFVPYNQFEQAIKIVKSLGFKHIKINPTQDGLVVSFDEVGPEHHVSPMFALYQAGLLD